MKNLEFKPNEFLRKECSKVFGVGLFRLKLAFKELGLNYRFGYFAKRMRNYSTNRLEKVDTSLSEFRLGEVLERKIDQNRQRLSDLKCYRGVRFTLNLPSRGQRTQTNARTSKRRRVIGGDVVRLRFLGFQRSSNKSKFKKYGRSKSKRTR